MGIFLGVLAGLVAGFCVGFIVGNVFERKLIGEQIESQRRFILGEKVYGTRLILDLAEAKHGTPDVIEAAHSSRQGE